MSVRFLGFLVVGGLGFLIDIGLTLGLIRLGLSPLLARPPSILAAMLFTWLANRHITFAVSHKKNVSEVVRYSGVALLAALLNYLIYSTIIDIGLSPLLGIVIATTIVAVFSYFGYKHIAFGLPTRS